MPHRMKYHSSIASSNGMNGKEEGSTIHCLKVNCHIPVREARVIHAPGSAECFACGKKGDACLRAFAS